MLMQPPGSAVSARATGAFVFRFANDIHRDIHSFNIGETQAVYSFEATREHIHRKNIHRLWMILWK